MPSRVQDARLPFLLVSGLLAIAGPIALPLNGFSQQTNASSVDKIAIAQSYGNIPLSFTQNAGQTDPRVKFISRGSGYGLFLTSDEAVVELTRNACNANPNTPARQPVRNGCSDSNSVVTMRLAGNTNAAAIPSGEDRLTGTANYFVGRDASNWQTQVPTFARVRYSSVYPGVDLVYYGNQRQLEYDFAVAPFADPSAIRLQFSGATNLKIDAAGDLIISAKNGDMAFRKPLIYQEQNGHRDLIAGHFTLGKRHTVGFNLGDYDYSKSLIIDPVLAYSTYLGGNGSAGDSALAIAVDSSGYAYVTGQTSSTNFPLSSGAYQTTNGGAQTSTFNAFVTKMNPTGTALIYSTYLGGSADTQATSLAVDSSSNAYVAGSTFATNFPTTAGAIQTATTEGSANYSAFVTKLNATGTALIYSTYLSGTGNGNGTGEAVNALALDASGNAYVAGYTHSTDYPVTAGAFESVNTDAPNGVQSAFLSKLNATGTALIYSTFLGGTASNGEGDSANALALDSSGDVYVTGSAGSTDFPTTANAYLVTNPAGANAQTSAFVTEFNPTASALIYSTYLGGSENSMGNAIAIDASGYAYIAGEAKYTDFPTTSGAYQTTNNAATLPATNAFVSKLDPSGSTLIYSTWLGGSGLKVNSFNLSGDSASGIAIDASGDAFVTGIAFSSNFPVTSGAYQTTNKASANKTYNAFVSELNPSGSGLFYSTFLGGTGFAFGSGTYYRGDDATALTLDASGNVYVTGVAYSADYPVTTNPYQSVNRATGTSGSNAFITKLGLGTSAAPTTTPTTTTLTTSAPTAITGTSVTFTASASASSGTTVPDGSATFTIDGSTYATVNLNASGVATYSISSLAVGSHTVVANYAGSSAFDASSSTALTETITAQPLVAAPKSSPVAGSYAAAQSVTLSSTTAGVTIYYTTDGTTPTTSSTLYTGAIMVAASETVKAFAIKSGYTNSGVASAAYTITTVAPPAFSLAAGSYGGTQTVSLTDVTPGAAIYYTTNGKTPTNTSTKYSTPISVTGTETIEAIAILSGYTNSAVASAKYTILPFAATPTFSVAAGTYPTTQSVTLADATTGSIVHYTTDGTTPTASSTQYSSPISVNATETIQAIAVATNYANSAVASASYTIQTPAAAPMFSIAAGTYPSTQSVALTDSTTGAAIYYTTNGTTPTTSSTLYSTAISVTATETINAIAVASGYNSSAVASAVYTIETPAATPTFSVAPGTYPTTQSVTLSDATSAAVIYYTTNGTTPTTSSTQYSTAISVTASETINAIAVAGGYNNSAVASAAYSIEVPAATPTFSIAADAYATTTYVKLADPTAGASIYYTVDGSTPTAASTLYTTTIAVTSAETVEAIAVAPGYLTSAVASNTFNGVTSAATPAFSIVGGTYMSPQSVALSDATAGAAIYYTTDGSKPTTFSTAYAGPITVTASETIMAIAVAASHGMSAVGSASYAIATPPTAASQAATSLTDAGVKLNAVVNTNHLATQYWFAYGTSATAMTATTTVSGPIAGSSAAVPVTATLTGLKPLTTYYYQIVVTNTLGTSSGTVLTFKTTSTSGSMEPARLTGGRPGVR